MRAENDQAARRDVAVWLALVAAGLALTWLAVRLGLRVGVRAAPFTGAYRAKIEIGTLLGPLVAAGVVIAARRRVAERLAWRPLLALAYAAAVAWALSLALVDGGNGLAGPVAHPTEYLVDVGRVGDDPARFVRDFVSEAPGYSVATRTHPPAPVLTLWALRQIGVTRPAALGLLITLVGCLTVPLVAVAVRSVSGERAARRLLPALVLAPWTVWLAVSMEAVAAALCAGFVACGVVASEPKRRPWWGLAAGILLGFAALYSYSVGWLAAVPLIVSFRRRRSALIAVVGVGALLPLLGARMLGFVWPDGLAVAQRDIASRVGDSRSWALWVALDILILVLACGPVLVTAVRRLRRSSGWPFVAGTVLAIGYAIGSGLARGEVERSWLPFFPWLLAPAVGNDESGRLPAVLLGVGALTAVVLEAVVRTVW